MANAEPFCRPSRITIPERCDPRAKIVFAEMKRQGVTYDMLEWKSGVLRSTFKAWRSCNAPSIQTLDAALGALGWAGLLPVPKPETLPAQLRADLEEVARKHALESLPALEMISACINFQHPGFHIDARSRRADA